MQRTQSGLGPLRDTPLSVAVKGQEDCTHQIRPLPSEWSKLELTSETIGRVDGTLSSQEKHRAHPDLGEAPVIPLPEWSV